VVRKSLPLEAVDVSKLEDLRCNPALLAELSALSGSDLNQSVAEAQLLRALVLAGLRSVLAVRITTSPKPRIPSIVELEGSSHLVGRVVCDDIIENFEDEVLSVEGAVTTSMLTATGEGLKAALALA